ncbi:ankyrin repeat domain-containing protein [Allokutzneria sp. A3M-2-11 16]|uniref:ankyrin repeat domain-containing protein n=1 Tax=Allokutzneria sp. A3M-2-11 16 TaxID=2962043 RepID=UPI0020B7028E|nr:ankyrin repeat domain-containing protein [Allokutzneria sp. A3M-2-11 16]MCP3803057.1 ankyrin repeat domain-containing protein [Allokutzneria sp. A3M-2-11 16]
MNGDRGGWDGLGWDSWRNLAWVRERLAAGADPGSAGQYSPPPLFAAAERGSADVVAELAGRVDDIDAERAGRTALWQAVHADRPDNARALVAAGADPWRPMMAGWSPGRLSLAGPTPDLFAPNGSALSTEESAVAVEARRLKSALGDLWVEGLGLACVADFDVEESAWRLGAEAVEDVSAAEKEIELDPLGTVASLTVWATDVPGGCVFAQPWGFAPSMPGVLERLSVDTVCYGLYCNPKSGNQGSIYRDGEFVGRDLSPGGSPDDRDTPEEILSSYLYRHNAVAYSCAFAGLRLTDARAIVGEPDVWLRLPERDYWH